jgi:hypothetical protein
VQRGYRLIKVFHFLDEVCLHLDSSLADLVTMPAAPTIGGKRQ